MDRHEQRLELSLQARLRRECSEQRIKEANVLDEMAQKLRDAVQSKIDDGTVSEIHQLFLALVQLKWNAYKDRAEELRREAAEQVIEEVE